MRPFTFMIYLLLTGFAQASPAVEVEVEVRQFPVAGHQLAGLLTQPSDGSARALVLIVHGYGETNVIEQNWYYDLRMHLASIGVASFVWDKPGSGRSEGDFDVDQPVASSADEVVEAARYLRSIKAPGSDRIGLWGISRAGWIAPLALSRDKRLAFWISVSGVDDKESFGYLLASNWRLMGYPEEEIDRLLSQWSDGNAAVAEEESYDHFLAVTKDYRSDPLVLRLVGDESVFSEASFNEQAAKWQVLSPRFDAETGLMIYVDDFDTLLSGLDVPVLALFGEKDTIVDWRSTIRLYKSTVGENSAASLSIATFPDGNHSLHISDTGGFGEILQSPRMVDGYYETILGWLEDDVLAR